MGERILFRKLQLTGGSTVTVSLPKEWIKTYNMNKGDIVNIEELASGDLRLSPLQKGSTKREIVIDCCAIKDGLIDLESSYNLKKLLVCQNNTFSYRCNILE